MMFDLDANPTIEERRQLVREKPTIAAEANPDGSFHAVFMPKQKVAEDATMLIAVTCHHQHPTVFHALLCANTVGIEMVAQGFGEVVDAS